MGWVAVATAVLKGAQEAGKLLGERQRCMEREVQRVMPKLFYRYERDSGPLFFAPTGEWIFPAARANALWRASGGPDALREFGVCQRIFNKADSDRRTLFHDIRPEPFKGVVLAADGAYYDAGIFGMDVPEANSREKAVKVDALPPTSPVEEVPGEPQKVGVAKVRQLGVPPLLAGVAGYAASGGNFLIGGAAFAVASMLKRGQTANDKTSK